MRSTRVVLAPLAGLTRTQKTHRAHHYVPSALPSLSDPRRYLLWQALGYALRVLSTIVDKKIASMRP